MPRIAPEELLSIGYVARRSGTSVSALRYYEERGLIRAVRSEVDRRLFPRHTLRRLAVIAAGRRIGLSLEQISNTLSAVRIDRAPTRREWTRISAHWAQLVAARISELQALQHDLDGCIGCGCLSLGRCTLFNPGDAAEAEGPGSRWVRAASTSATAQTETAAGKSPARPFKQLRE
ncbi:redox-sensitive transcriptional activator SoxR [Arthrobacter bambusae]|uniref:redox-sensitive transcriptional activator SoxR n=1 Tax=Arthrobacter bambusae TaxID=1338426 RepID=UPI002787FB7D|nr:redox-sensitive transcriptional activator SoxR [Arthrobacter bambusae]MDQ0213096.1 MerR family redox-sensitive transcriptional activator SoxR [Arthrobacter bambusae]MDQ0237454.1 MerR family redox-sensitive transcriptional activator SoxR [Arthrobacter bambusae]